MELVERDRGGGGGWQGGGALIGFFLKRASANPNPTNCNAEPEPHDAREGEHRCTHAESGVVTWGSHEWNQGAE